MKKKPWKIALIVLVTISIVLGLLWLSPMIFFVAQEMYGEKLVQNTKKVASVELVSQEKPLVFFELMEQPPIKGVKVKIAYKDGSSEVVNAYNVKIGHYDQYASYKGMYFETRTRHDNSRTSEPLLEPGLHSIKMYYINDSYSLEYGYNDEDQPNLGYCMVEVYAQTAEEYIAERKPPHAIVTEDSSGELSLKKNESGLIQFLAEEGGTYRLKIESDFYLDFRNYMGSGSLFQWEDGHFYAQLNANEPLYLRAQALERSGSLRISLTRVPENEVLAQ